MASQNPDTTGVKVESSTENGNPEQNNQGGNQRVGGNFRRGGPGGRFGGRGRFHQNQQNHGQGPNQRNDNMGGQGQGLKRDSREMNQRNFHREADHAMKTPQEKLQEKLNQLGGMTIDLPPLDMTEKKFSGRNRLYIGNIGNEVSEEELVEFFKSYGEVSEVFVNKEKNFGFVKFDFHSNAEKAKRELDGSALKGRNLRIRFAPGGTAIRVKNLTPHVSNELLHHGFQVFGEIERATILIDDRGKHTGEGIVEFVRKGSAIAAVRQCREGCFFLTSSLRPCIVEPHDVIEDSDGLPDKLINKRNPEFQKEREVGPRFAQPNSFENEYGMRWKQLHELFAQKEEALKKELEMEKEKLEAQMEYAKYEHETEMLREQLRVREMDKERQDQVKLKERIDFFVRTSNKTSSARIRERKKIEEAGAGTVIAWSSPAISELSPPKELNISNEGVMLDLVNNGTNHSTSTRIILTKKEEALIGSFVNLGSLIYAVPSGCIADKFGRKVALYSSGISFIVGWCLIVFANNVPTLLLGRIFGGMGLGAVLAVGPIYIGEIADNSVRAKLCSYFPFFIGAGILSTFVVGSFTNYITMSIVLAIFPMLLLVIFPFVPESHVYFLKIGQTKEAEESLVRLRGNEADYDIRGEMKTIQEEIDQNRDRGGSFIDSLSSVANRRALVAVLGTMGFHQLCGVNAVVFYVEQIFTAAETSIEPSVGAIIVVCFQCIGGFLSLKIIDRAGRKYFLILSAVGMLMGHCGLGMFFHLRKYNMGSSLGFLPIGCVIMFIVAFTLGYGNIPFMLSHELLPPELRGVGSGLAIVVAWTISFLVTYVFPIAVVHLGDYITFYILGAANAIAILFTLQFVPETRGKTLIDIQEILSR